MARFQMVDYCLFVDAKNYETNQRYPKELPFAHILDQRQSPAIYLKLNDGESYIARFIVQGIDTALIPEILKSEYRTTLGNKVDTMDFAAEVQAVLQLIAPYVEKRTHQRDYQPPSPPLPAGKDRKEKYMDKNGKSLVGYELDFRVNWFGIGCCKFPC